MDDSDGLLNYGANTRPEPSLYWYPISEISSGKPYAISHVHFEL